MSNFRPTVRGLEKLPYALDGSGSSSGGTALTGMSGMGTMSCQGWDTIVECPGPDAGIGSFSLPLASIPFNTSADYFAVLCNINGPTLDGRSCNVPAGPADYVCQGMGDSLYDGTVDVGSWVRSTGGGIPGYEAVPNDYHADTTQPGSWFTSHTSWPDNTMNQYFDPHNIAFLLNPAPVWPVPDVVNNHFGAVLFTLAQLPGAIETTISYFCYEQVFDGSLRLAVWAYNNTMDPGVDAFYGDVSFYV